ncbi:WG repeat-containing protein [Spirosoma areae]
MTETELTDRLREAIVLDGPDIWRTNGYLQEAQQAGISLADALKRANEISQEVANNTLLFQNIQARIARMAQPSRSHLVEQDLAQILNAATSLKLSADFVRNRWVPAVLQRLTATTASQKPEPAPAPAPVDLPAVVTEPVNRPIAFEELIESKPEPPALELAPAEPVKPIVPISEPAVFVPPPVVVVQQPVKTPGIPEPTPIVRSFTATPARVHKGQPVTLEWEVENLLAVTIDDLGEGLSAKNRGWVKPSKSTEYTLFDVNNNPLSTVRVEVIPRDRSGIYGVLFALVILALIYWFIKSSNARDTDAKPKSKTEQTTRIPKAERSANESTVSRQEPEKNQETSEASDTPAVVAIDNPKTNAAQPDTKPVDETPALPAGSTEKPSTLADARSGKYKESFGDKPYDKVELGTDEQGWRRARSNGRWGFINDADEWVIKPEYEAVTPFRGNTASAFLNGQLMTINRAGEQVRN